MKKIITITIVLFLLTEISVLASSTYQYDYSSKNYVCTSRNGSEAGYGRVVKEGEYSSYFGRSARRGEFIAFQYTRRGKEYWFPVGKCRRR